MSSVKEPQYFAAADNAVWRGPGDAQPVTSLDRYLRLFAVARPDQHLFAGEASTLYLSAQDAPRRVHALSPDAVVLCVLRHPIDRAWSHFVQHRAQAREVCRRFPDAVACEPERSHDGWAPFWRYTYLSHYKEHLQRWLAAFPAARVGVFLFEDLERDSSAFLASVARFLGVEPLHRPLIPASSRNDAHLPRNLVAARVLAEDNGLLSKGARMLVPARYREHWRWLLRRWNGRSSSGELTSAERVELARLFEDDVRYVEAISGRALRSWTR